MQSMITEEQEIIDNRSVVIGWLNDEIGTVLESEKVVNDRNLERIMMMAKIIRDLSEGG